MTDPYLLRHMSSEPYLVAHKVRGEAAFDIAIQMPCPECDNDPGCSECDGLGYWWIIPTSGHRAYPFAHWEYGELMVGDTIDGYVGLNAVLPEMPPNLPDHFQTRTEPTVAKKSLLAELGLDRPTVKINRRI